MLDMRARLQASRLQGPGAGPTQAELGEYLANLRAHQDLWSVPLRSGRPGLGAIVGAVRRLLLGLLGPVLNRQIRFNAAATTLLAALADEAAAREHHGQECPWEHRAYLTLLCGLRENSSLLELGCARGGTALALLDYLKPPGRYEGLDVRRAHVEFAQSRIHASLPQFNFTHADVQDAVENPGGAHRAASFRFPYDDATFEVVFAASALSRLEAGAMENYLTQIRRVLKSGGRCLLGVRIAATPGDAAGVDLDSVRRAASAARLELIQVVPGRRADSNALLVLRGA